MLAKKGRIISKNEVKVYEKIGKILPLNFFSHRRRDLPGKFYFARKVLLLSLNKKTNLIVPE